ncbi:MAG: alcohol dehydrogenase [Candidatus Altiarchaeales archaeon WOR_SM1_79]|nr:MAG: alcohol dehydrogenase [Candidatus Altiarchaeales archaeon WOR_SM1_79]
MKAAVMHGIGDIRIESRAQPKPKLHEVLVQMRRVGVCASDIHYFNHGRIGDFVVKDPLILGHESAGVVLEVGSAVTRFQPGDRVTVEPGYTCRRCHYCKTGRYNLCPDVTFLATPPIDGAFCEAIVWPEDFLFSLPDGMNFEEGAMMEPLSVGLWAVKRGGVVPGHTVAIFGAGPIGLATLQAAKIAGATTLIAIDLSSFRLEHARRLGATFIINANKQDPIKCIREIASETTGFTYEHSGTDVAFETAGALAATRAAMAAARPGGVVMLVGLPPDPLVELDIVSAASKEIDIRGQFRYANCYPRAIALTAAERVDMKSLVTHHFPLSQTSEALRFADKAKSEALKVMVDVTE